jgi:hypothetical protein
MPMLKHIFTIFVLSFLAATVAFGQSSQTKQHILDEYEKISVDVPVPENPYPSIAKVRDFISRHWKERTLGYVEMTLRSKEGEPTTSYIFIEPDRAGVWRVATRIERELHDRRLVGDPKRTGEIIRQTQNYEAYFVEQIKPPKGKVVQNLKNQRNSYLLRLKDRNGNILAEL